MKHKGGLMGAKIFHCNSLPIP